MIPRSTPYKVVPIEQIQTVAVTVRDVLFFYGHADVHVLTPQGGDTIMEHGDRFNVEYEDGSREVIYKTQALRAVRQEERIVQRQVEAFKPEIH